MRQGHPQHDGHRGELPLEGERRHVTVLFADLVGFTAFSERAGEEAAYGLMQYLAKLLRIEIEARGGTVRGFTGDGVMALFGVPQAQEDAPLNACRAALSIQRRIVEEFSEYRSEVRAATRAANWYQYRLGNRWPGRTRRRCNRHCSWRCSKSRFSLAGTLPSGVGSVERDNPTIGRGEGRSPQRGGAEDFEENLDRNRYLDCYLSEPEQDDLTPPFIVALRRLSGVVRSSKCWINASFKLKMQHECVTLRAIPASESRGCFLNFESG